jgi:hypothetical protein
MSASTFISRSNMDAQSPNTSFPAPNVGIPVEKRYPALAKAPKPPVRSVAPPTTTDLLYKGSAACDYPALRKLAAERIGKVKCQPSPMCVTAVGEGDMSRLKVKSWQRNGEEAFEGIKPHG